MLTEMSVRTIKKRIVMAASIWLAIRKFLRAWRKPTLGFAKLKSAWRGVTAYALLLQLLLSGSAVAVTAQSQSATFSANYQHETDFSRWQQRARQLAEQSLLSVKPRLSATMRIANVQINHRQHSDPRLNYQQQQWQLVLQFADEQVQLTVDLLLPLNRDVTKPAILLLHDHGAEFRLGRHKYLPAEQGPLPALTQDWQQKYFDGVALAPLLANAGYPVLLADAPGFGERGPLRYEEQQQLAASFLARGQSLAGRVAREDQALATWLSQQLQQPVLAVGFSFGGFRALQLAALEPEVDGAISIGWFNSLQFLRQPGNNFAKGQTAFYMLHPGLYHALDLPQFWALAAPKPLLVLMGALDPLMPPAQVATAFASLQQYYQACRPIAGGHQAGQSTQVELITPPIELRTAAQHGHQAGLWFQQQLLTYLAQFSGNSAVCSN